MGGTASAGATSTAAGRPASSRPARRPRDYAPFLALATIFVYGAGCTLLVGAPGRPLDLIALGETTGFLLHALVGALLMWHRPDNVLGVLFGASGAALVLAAALDGYAYFVQVAAPGSGPGGVWAWWMRDWVGVTAWAALAAYSLLLLPDGRLPSPRWRPVGYAAGALVVVAGLVAALRPGRIGPGVPAGNPAGIERLGPLLTALDRAMPYAVAVAALVGLVSVAVRWWHAWGRQRRRLAWAVVGILLAVFLLAVVGLAREPGMPDVWLVAAAMAALPAAVALGAMREDLVDIEKVLNRGVVLTGSLVIALGAWLGVYRLADVWLGTVPSLVVGALGALLLAAGLLRFRDRMERQLGDTLFGQRRRAEAVTARLAEVKEMHSAGVPLLRLLSEELRTMMEVPFVAVRRPPPALDLVTGTPGTGLVALPLTYAGHHVGTLEIGARVPGEGFTETEHQLLGSVADQMAAVVRSARLRESLQVARAWLVRSRELEKERVNRLRRERAGTDSQVSGPPVLDDLGLPDAIDATAMPLRVAGIDVRLDVPADLPTLDSSLEVAAYQIVADALDNVRRHADAGSCQVRVRLDAWALEVEVLDDGAGIDGTAGGGVASMLRAAEQVDGTLAVLPRDPRGTRVHAVLPRLRVGPRPAPDDAPER